MGLFKKKPKYTEQRVKCVHCGRTHILRKYFAEEYYLDGMPKLPPEQLLAQYTICECSALIYPSAAFNPVTKEQMQTQEYKTALKKTYPNNVLALLQVQFPNVLEVALLQMHIYYNETTLQYALQCLPPRVEPMQAFNISKLPQLQQRRGKFEYSSRLCAIDLLRQSGNWGECWQVIQQERIKEFPPISPEYQSFLCHEEMLVHKQDPSLQ